MAINNGRTLTAEEKDEFAYELALGYFDMDSLRLKFGLTPQAFQMYIDSDEIGLKRILKQREIDEDDNAMKIHARRAARVAINDMAALVQDEDAPAKTRMDASRQLREFATIVDRNAIAESSGDGAIYIRTNLDLGAANGVYAVTAKEADEQMSDAENTDDSPAPDADFSDLLGV